MLCVVMLLTFAIGAAQQSDGDWLSDHSTLLVGVVGVIVSGFVGPAVTGWLTGKRDRARDRRAREVGLRDGLRDLTDEAARLLAVGATNLRRIHEAQRAGEAVPEDADEWQRSVFPMLQRLRLRLPAEHPVVSAFDSVHKRLVAVAETGNDDAKYKAALASYESARDDFLDAAREAIRAPISDKEQT